MIHRIHLAQTQSNLSKSQSPLFWSIIDKLDQAKLGHIGLNESYKLTIEIYPEFRKKGIATEAMCQVNKLLNTSQINLVSASISNTNFAAAQLFKNFSRLKSNESYLNYVWSPEENITDWRKLHKLKIDKLNARFNTKNNNNDSISLACQLTYVDQDIFDRPYFMHPKAANAWVQMQKSAQKDQVNLEIISAYRDFEYQAQLIQNKLNKGQSIVEILKVNALPGYSEHHSGCAIDIGSKDGPILEPEFDQTEAFKWLQNNATIHNFHLSYPEANGAGIIYEPWHWCYQPFKHDKPETS